MGLEGTGLGISFDLSSSIVRVNRHSLTFSFLLVQVLSVGYIFPDSGKTPIFWNTFSSHNLSPCI